MHCHLKALATFGINVGGVGRGWWWLRWHGVKIFCFQVPIEVGRGRMLEGLESSKRLFKLYWALHRIKRPLSLQCNYIDFMDFNSYTCDMTNAILQSNTQWIFILIILQHEWIQMALIFIVCILFVCVCVYCYL